MLDLGSAALAYLTELTHRRPQLWIHDVDVLPDLLQTHCDATLRRAFERGLTEQAIGAEYIAHYLGDARPGRPFDPDADRPPTIATRQLPRAGRVQITEDARRGGVQRSAAPGRGRARRYDLAASEAGHDGARSGSGRALQTAASRQRPPRVAGSRAARGARSWSVSRFLTLLVGASATDTTGPRHTGAQFPFLKTIDDFNFTYQSTLRLHMLGSAIAPDFVTEGRSLNASGKPGRGKTHQAIAVAHRAIQNGFDAVFTTAATLIDDLSAGFRAGQLSDAPQTYTHPSV